MLTEKQRLELKQMMDQKLKSFGQVPSEEMEKYPVNREEREIPVSNGTSRVIFFSSGEENANRPLFLNFHGGGFIGKHMDRDERFCRELAYTFHGLVLDVDYCLAPANPYPAAVNECWELVQWVWNHLDELKVCPDKILLVGHSSGGNLAAGLCMRLGESGLFRPAALVMDYPPLDLFTDPEEKPASICDMPPERARDYNKKYIAPEQSKEPYASPLFAPEEMLEYFPDTLIISAGEDRLSREDEEFGLRLARAGVAVTMKRFTASVHGFVINQMCEWEEAMELIRIFVKNHIE